MRKILPSYSKIPNAKPNREALSWSESKWLAQRGLLGHFKTQQLGKKLAFGAPMNMRKGQKVVDSHWFIHGGATETKRVKH
jgi:hypothetical protein